MKPLKVNITLSINLRDFGAFEDLVGELGGDPDIKCVDLIKTNGVAKAEPKPEPKRQKRKSSRHLTGDDVKYIKRLLAKPGATPQSVHRETDLWAASTIGRVALGERDHLIT